MYNATSMKQLLKRVLARLFDWGLFYTLGVFLTLILPIGFDDKFYFSFVFLTPLLWAPLEALMLSTWETTPGKALFGISVRGLSFIKSLKRALFWGKRPGVPTFSPIRRWRLVLGVALTGIAASTLFMGKDLSNVAIQYESQVAKSGWVQYASDDGRFTIQFPKKPSSQETQKVDVADGKALELKVVKAESDAIFSVSYLDLPRKWRIFSSNILLKISMKEIVGHMEGAELTDKQMVKHKNYPAMSFKIKQGDNEIEGRLILVKNTMYKLTVVYPPGVSHEGQHETFLDSFELKSP